MLDFSNLLNIKVCIRMFTSFIYNVSINHCFLFQTICFGCRKKALNTNDLDMFEASQLTSKSSSNTQGNV